MAWDRINPGTFAMLLRVRPRHNALALGVRGQRPANCAQPGRWCPDPAAVAHDERENTETKELHQLRAACRASCLDPVFAFVEPDTAVVAAASCTSTPSKSSGAPIVPVVDDGLPILENWCQGRTLATGSSARNWPSVRWREAPTAIGHPDLRVHDLRHTAASLWLGSGADPKVVTTRPRTRQRRHDDGSLWPSHRPEPVGCRQSKFRPPGAFRGHPSQGQPSQRDQEGPDKYALTRDDT